MPTTTTTTTMAPTLKRRRSLFFPRSDFPFCSPTLLVALVCSPAHYTNTQRALVDGRTGSGRSPRRYCSISPFQLSSSQHTPGSISMGASHRLCQHLRLVRPRRSSRLVFANPDFVAPHHFHTHQLGDDSGLAFPFPSLPPPLRRRHHHHHHHHPSSRSQHQDPSHSSPSSPSRSLGRRRGRVGAEEQQQENQKTLAIPILHPLPFHPIPHRLFHRMEELFVEGWKEGRERGGESGTTYSECVGGSRGASEGSCSSLHFSFPF
ncbi:hypothetical protein BCR35DRAFT_6969 [Leucosporidium creatinivorum]|uniref:Uncharacterized protein n=1 Tax=Leucosporidium creatinivorum TaxID=106004 RepID=A0A1Y2G5V0_9BASI|nr:hypothetical protein BCR35DRAFT_6969 [Leucosporidium creatinivorum]